MKQSLVAMVTDIRDFDGNRWHVTPRHYIEAAVNQAGVFPVLVPCMGEKVDVDELLDTVHGLILTGSKTNVHPSLYGEDAVESDGPFDRDRDATSLLLIKKAIERNMPILAICRGLQELNVALGGTILRDIQNMANIQDHRAPESSDMDERFVIHQDIRVKKGSPLAKILGEENVLVNSLHRQAIGRLGDGLQIDALANDGTIEAISSLNADHFMLGVQWHPEYWAATDDTSTKILRAFGDAVRCRRHG